MRLRSDPLDEEQVLNKEQGATLIPGVVEKKGGPGRTQEEGYPPEQLAAEDYGHKEGWTTGVGKRYSPR